MASLYKRTVDGFALIEAILFMVIVGVATGALLSLFAGNAQRTSTAMVERQALDIAEAVLAEVKSADFGAGEALSPAGPEPGEQRLGPQRFNHINDYAGTVIGPGIRDIHGALMVGTDAFIARIRVEPMPGGATWNGMPSSEAALITVAVEHPTLPAAVSLQGIRTRHDMQ